MARSTLAGQKRVKLQIEAAGGSEVYVAGTFNGWNPRKNKLRYKSGIYATSILMPKGKHEYKFVVDGTWCVDPQCPEWSPNGLGSLNSVITVA